MDNKGAVGRITRAQSKSPARSKVSTEGPKSKSPARQKSPGRSKSPGRTKSPARSKSPGRPKKEKLISPGRSPRKISSPERTISPIRKISPVGRFTPTLTLSEAARITRRSPFVQLNRNDEISITKSVETSNTEVEFTRESSVSVPNTSPSMRVYSTESSLIQRSSRLRRHEDFDEIISSNADGDKVLKPNNVPLPPQFERKYGEKPMREFGSWPGALFLMLLLPILAVLLQVACSKIKCIGISKPSTNWRVYLDLHSAGYYLGFFLWQALLSSLPVGKKASYGHVHARISGFYNALLTLSVLGGLYYYGINVTSVLDKSLAIMSTAILTGVSLALLLFFKGRKTSKVYNLNADGNKIYDFFIGRETLPSFGPLNVKSMLVRAEIIGILLLDILYFLKYKETHAAGVNSPTLIFVIATHILYIFDTLWFEEKFMTTFEAQYEGVGYMTVMAAAVWPFLITLTTRFIAYTGYEAPVYLLVISGITFLIGYLIYRASNSQKAEYRLNPQNPVFAKYETISTFHGKRLLCGGWWGLVRHPNYLGDIVMMWSVAAPCGFAHWLPYVFPALHSAVLIHRTFRINYRCKSLYGAAWDRYNQIVKYRLVPRVF